MTFQNVTEILPEIFKRFQQRFLQKFSQKTFPVVSSKNFQRFRISEISGNSVACFSSKILPVFFQKFRPGSLQMVPHIFSKLFFFVKFLKVDFYEFLLKIHQKLLYKFFRNFTRNFQKKPQGFFQKYFQRFFQLIKLKSMAKISKKSVDQKCITVVYSESPPEIC